MLNGAELRRIGGNLYRGIEHNGQPAWQGWLAAGLCVDATTVRRWLMEKEHSTQRDVPPTIAHLLLAADSVAEKLALWECRQGTLIAQRMAELIGTSSRAKAGQPLNERQVEHATQIVREFVAWTPETGKCPIGINDKPWFKRLCALAERIAALEVT